jgi:hypothetical protein
LGDVAPDASSSTIQRNTAPKAVVRCDPASSFNLQPSHGRLFAIPQLKLNRLVPQMMEFLYGEYPNPDEIVDRFPANGRWRVEQATKRIDVLQLPVPPVPLRHANLK